MTSLHYHLDIIGLLKLWPSCRDERGDALARELLHSEASALGTLYMSTYLLG